MRRRAVKCDAHPFHTPPNRLTAVLCRGYSGGHARLDRHETHDENDRFGGAFSGACAVRIAA
jgi:hypothetical protein